MSYVWWITLEKIHCVVDRAANRMEKALRRRLRCPIRPIWGAKSGCEGTDPRLGGRIRCVSTVWWETFDMIHRWVDLIANRPPNPFEAPGRQRSLSTCAAATFVSSSSVAMRSSFIGRLQKVRKPQFGLRKMCSAR